MLRTRGTGVIVSKNDLHSFIMIHTLDGMLWLCRSNSHLMVGLSENGPSRGKRIRKSVMHERKKRSMEVRKSIKECAFEEPGSPKEFT